MVRPDNNIVVKMWLVLLFVILTYLHGLQSKKKEKSVLIHENISAFSNITIIPEIRYIEL